MSQVTVGARDVLRDRINGIEVRVSNETAQGKLAPLSEGTICARGPLYENVDEIPLKVEVICEGWAAGRFVQFTRKGAMMDITELVLVVHDIGK